MRVIQPLGSRGSLKWIQRAVNEQRGLLDILVSAEIPTASEIVWISPLAADDYSEYRDGTFLERIGQSQLQSALSSFWPSRGPQWDALALIDGGVPLLVEAKAHIDEMFSSGMQAKSDESRQLIEKSLAATVRDLNATPHLSWTGPLYQTANRIAHLKFLTDQGIDAHLLFLCFVGDSDVGGPTSADEWRGALLVVRRMLGLPEKHVLSDRILHVFMPIDRLT